MRSTRLILCVCASCSVLLMATWVAQAQGVPNSISYQGQLTNTVGQPVADGPYNVQFKLYTVDSGGAAFWTSAVTSVTTARGIFATRLTPITAADLSGKSDIWLEVWAGSPLAALSPRIKLDSVAFALRAGDLSLPFVGSVASAAPALSIANTGAGLAARFAGNVGIGNSAFDYTTRLDITGGNNWDLTNTEGDVRIGNSTYRLKIGVALGGGGAGSASIRAVGGINQLALGTGANETLVIRDNRLGVGAGDPAFPLDVNGVVRSRAGGFQFPDGTTQTTAATGGASGWGLSGNSGTTAGTNFVGTTDSQPLEMKVNSSRGLRLEYGFRALGKNTWESSMNLIGGSSNNNVTGGAIGGTVGGGGYYWTDGFLSLNRPNMVTDDYGTVAGGLQNTVGDGAGTVSDRPAATVGGGRSNTAAGSYSTIAGGEYNTAIGRYSFVGGGGGFESLLGSTYNLPNTASGDWSTIGGGGFNTASGSYSTVAGGGGGLDFEGWSYTPNQATGERSFVGGGGANTAEGASSVVSGGFTNRAGSFASVVGGGYFNVASNTYSTVPGGYDNASAGVASFAAGARAKANHDGSFVWADNTGAAHASTGANQFRARASGGTWFYSNSAATTGVYLSPGSGSWADASDRTLKTAFSPVDKRDILSKVSAMPISAWSYKSQDPSIRHVGPVAQDFAAAFQVGEDDKHISTVDAQGVAFAAIQGLYELVQEQRAEVSQLKSERDAQVADLQSQIAQLKRALAQMAAHH